jgi:dTDP-4-dehydrorhamnose 3,5-epimerase
VNPLDPEIGIEWPGDVEPLLSSKDAAAPSLREAQERGLLPTYDACTAYYAELCSRGKA